MILIFEAITTNRPHLRYLVGVDAGAWPPGGHASATRSGELSDEEYNQRFKRYFGIELRELSAPPRHLRAACAGC